METLPLAPIDALLSRKRAFSCDVIAAMLEDKNNTFSLPWENLFSWKLFHCFQPSNMVAVKTLYLHNLLL